MNGPELAASYVARTTCGAAICHDGTVIKHPADRSGLAGMILEVWFEEVYSGAFYTPQPGHVIVDAGANIGLFSLHMARRQPGVRIVAFEPFEENFRLLQQNLSSVCSMVNMLPMALSGDSGTAQMVDGGERSQDHRLTRPRADDEGPPNIKTPNIKTLSFGDVLDLCGSQPIALFKCDIEGSEFDLFEAATEEGIARVSRYAIEYHDHIRPGTLRMLSQRLDATHALTVKPATDGDYGMLYAVAKRLVETS